MEAFDAAICNSLALGAKKKGRDESGTERGKTGGHGTEKEKTRKVKIMTKERTRGRQ